MTRRTMIARTSWSAVVGLLAAAGCSSEPTGAESVDLKASMEKSASTPAGQRRGGLDIRSTADDKAKAK